VSPADLCGLPQPPHEWWLKTARNTEIKHLFASKPLISVPCSCWNHFQVSRWRFPKSLGHPKSTILVDWNPWRLGDPPF
jgi:hypothetical protein